ncbi:hypothetical protein Pmani_024550 [Petrolisthes manimaculis]|uniref:Fatty acid desaturase domain-containing protein n=1 Tax=Petrolisthes manimaculis TaxID=1843537 RepID=A0AAE1P7D6_9EUCA|nr:hypothetical protein Pmani_024550 [Petrolisthes manimaculis]
METPGQDYPPMSYPKEQLHFGEEVSYKGSPLLEERELKVDIRKIFNDLRNLDWSKVVWRNVVLFTLLHIYAVYGLFLAIVFVQWKTIIFSFMLVGMSALGITMGAHRLWAHRSYKAKFPLRFVLAVFQTIAFQNHIYEWARDHRVHHKHSETDADPHNARRGFFFSHMGWLMYKKHPDVITKGRKLDMSDLERDLVVRFQRKYYLPLVLLLCFVVPAVIPWLFWGEHIVNALMVAAFLRYALVLHFTWTVNSLAHWVGIKPYDKHIYPSQNKIVTALTFGEGWHNYHHVFPWDYKTSEFGGFTEFNFTSFIIETCCFFGLAYDLTTVSKNWIAMRAERTGDGSYTYINDKDELC